MRFSYGFRRRLVKSSAKLLVYTILILKTSSLGAQSHAMNGVIEGIIRGENGSGLAGVTVVLKNQDNGVVRQFSTNTTGGYRAPLLPLGSYEILAQREGYPPVRRTSVVLEVGQTVTVNLTLLRTPGVETLKVAATTLVDVDRKQPSTTVNNRLVQNLPLYGRKFMDLGVMVPGATEFGDRDTSSTADFAGTNHFYSNALVDGVYTYQAWSGLPGGKFQVPFEYSENAIREFQVLNGNFTAEFGRSAGGLVNAVTKSGTNQVHGDSSYYFSDSSMNASPRFAFTKPQTRQQEIAGSLGGPAMKDRLFLFGNYDQVIRREPLIVIPGTVLDGFDSTLATITNPDERQRYLAGRDFVRSLIGDFNRGLNHYTFLTRSDWHPSPKHSVSARYNFQHFHETNVPENGFNNPIISGMAVSNNGQVGVKDGTLALQWSASISPQTLNEARMQFALGDETQIPNADGPQVRIGSGKTGITFGRRDVFPGVLREKRWQWVDNITFVRGAHEIKTGVEFDHVTDRNSNVANGSGTYQFNNLRDFVNGRYMSFTQGFGVPDDTVTSPYYAAFIQDNFKAGSKLSINAGLRYEYQKLQPASIANPLFPQSSIAPQDKNNFGPRLALAWQASENLVIRSSYGIYYGLLSVQANSYVRTQNGVVQNLREFRNNTPGAPVYPQIFTGTSTLQTPQPGSKITVFSPDFVSPYIQQVNLEVEKEIASNLSVTTGWIYTKGTKLRSNEDLNLFPPGSRTVQINDTARNISGLITVPYFGGPSSRPFPFFDQISEYRSDNSSVYHAGFVQLNKRYSRGLQLLFDYTFSKMIDKDQAPGNQITCCTSDNPFDTGSERGLGRRDQRHRVNLAAVWDLPKPTSGSFSKSLIRNWRLNTIARVGSGRPFTATVTGDSGGDLNGDNVRGGDRAPWFGRGTFIGPGYQSVDLGLHRIFIAEGKSFDIGFEVFNVFNHANYLKPAPEYYQLTNVAGGVSRLDGPLPSFGKPQDATPSRQMQAVIKFSF
jgi:hypothetical protein